MKKEKGDSCFLLLFSLLILTVLLIGCKANTVSEAPAPPEEAGEEESTDTIEEEEPEPLGEPSPFTGLPVAEIYNRPYAIIVENLLQARPQSGLRRPKLSMKSP